MSGELKFYLFAAAAMLLLPAAVLFAAKQERAEHASSAAENVPQATYYRILRKDSGEIEQVSARDYVIGAVAAEMPASYPEEALKAQAVVCRTYAERIRLQNSRCPLPALKGADLSDDPAHYQGYFSRAQMEQEYGAQFASCYAKIAAAVDAAGDSILYYDGEPIVAAYHALSPGQTESAEAVFGSAFPYLTPVDSHWDKDVPPETVRLPQETVRRSLEKAFSGISLPEDPKDWFSAPECSASGTVLHIRCGGLTLTGQQLREALALRSAAFAVQCDAETVTFTVCGYGHGVGMSQNGAGEMARKGMNSAAILAHYYPGTELRPASGAAFSESRARS